MVGSKTKMVRMEVFELRTDPTEYKIFSPVLRAHEPLYVDIPVKYAGVKKADGGGMVLTMEGFESFMREVGITILKNKDIYLEVK